MPDQLVFFDTLYALAAGDANEAALFGTCAPMAREAFRRSLIGEEPPTIWFELPLKGTPRFDLHVAISRQALHAGVGFSADAGNGYDALFDWYASEERGGNGLAFAYDVGEGRIVDPAVHVNVNKAPLSDMGRFFDLAAAGEGAARRYQGFVERLPGGWRVWYAGVHPGRPGFPVRVDCFVERSLRDAYAVDPSLLGQDLRSCGFVATGPALLDLLGPVLKSPFGLELQFDVMGDGEPGPTLGISASLPFGAASTMRQLFDEGGPVAGLMDEVEGLGLADGRWRHVPDAMFTRLVMLDDGPLVLYCVPTFLKLRMRDGVALDAKLYLQASSLALGDVP